MKGYQIIEFDSIDNFRASITDLSLEIALFLRLTQLVKEKYNLPDSIELDIIKAEYLGSYPTIGVHYHSEDTENIEQILCYEFQFMIENTSISELLNFMSSNVEEIHKIKKQMNFE